MTTYMGMYVDISRTALYTSQARRDQVASRWLSEYVENMRIHCMHVLHIYFA